MRASADRRALWTLLQLVAIGSWSGNDADGERPDGSDVIGSGVERCRDSLGDSEHAQES